jgi:hypothetical protein
LWYYERTNGWSTRIDDYVDRADSERAKAELVRWIAAHHWKAQQEFAWGRARIERLTVAIHISA